MKLRPFHKTREFNPPFGFDRPLCDRPSELMRFERKHYGKIRYPMNFYKLRSWQFARRPWSNYV